MQTFHRFIDRSFTFPFAKCLAPAPVAPALYPREESPGPALNVGRQKASAVWKRASGSVRRPGNRITSTRAVSSTTGAHMFVQVIALQAVIKGCSSWRVGGH